MKLNRIYLPLVGAVLFGSSMLNAQTNCVNVSSINLNTGYNYTTGAIISAGNPDPEWRVTALTSGCAGISGAAAIGSSATVINPWGTWVASPSSGWLSFTSSGGYITNGTGAYDYGMTISREFKTCKNDSLKFQFSIADDNFCSSITIDGVSIGFSQAAGIIAGNYSAFNAVPTVVRYLSSGTHTISVTVYNYPASGTNPHGVNLQGVVSSVSGSSTLVSPRSSVNCVCMTNCSDSCYWKVYGNTILNGNNVFGTLSRDDIRIQTSAIDRGIITQDGLFGWNTVAPTAFLHVNCNGNNPADGYLSDVRFENLEPGKGSLLVINEEGYVTNSRIDMSQLQADNERLKAQVEDLGNKVRMLSLGTSVATDKSVLYQNNPNPFNDKTSIAFFIDQLKSSAFIGIYDMNGKELKRYNVGKQGNGSIDVDNSNLTSGMYLYSLVVDGQIIDTKKMVLSK